MNYKFLHEVFLGNSITDYLTFMLILVSGIVIIKIWKEHILEKVLDFLKLRKTVIDDKLISSLNQKIFPLFYLLVIHLSLGQITLPTKVDFYLNILLLILTIFFGNLLLQAIIIYSVKKYWGQKEKNVEQEKILHLTTLFIRIFIWILAFVFFLDNLNIKMTGLLTGLGIGGVALGFAAQSVLTDLFSYFTIFFDRPFDIGDYVNVGDYRGTIESIGLKTTKIRSLGGEQLVIANTDLMNSRINNYGRMRRRRINFSFGVIYGTELEKLKLIPDIVKNIINDIAKTELDRVHFASFGDYSLIYQVVYYVLDSDYKLYMDIQQEINFKLKEIFVKNNIQFAFPSQTLYFKQDSLSTDSADELNENYLP